MVILLPLAQHQRALFVLEVGRLQDIGGIGVPGIVQRQSVSLDELARLAAARAQTAFDEHGQDVDARAHFGRAHRRGRRVGQIPFPFKEGARGVQCLSRLGFAVDHPGDFERERFLGPVDVRAGLVGHPLQLSLREEREDPQEQLDVAVVDVAQELEELVGRRHRGVEPDGVACALAVFAPVLAHEQREGEREGLALIHAPVQIRARQDVRPLIVAAHLQDAIVFAREVQEIVGLKELVTEFHESQPAALEPAAVDVGGQQAGHGEVDAHVTREVDPAHFPDPVDVVHEHRRVGHVEAEVRAHERLEVLDVAFDLRLGIHLAHFRPARRIADEARRAAEEDDGREPAVLGAAKPHERDEVADMEAFRRGIVAAIHGERFAVSGARTFRKEFGEFIFVAHLRHQTAFLEMRQKRLFHVWPSML